MRRRLVRGGLFGLGLLGVAATLVATRGSAAAPTGAATVTLTKGTTERAAGGGEYSTVAVGAALNEGDRLRTGAASRLELKLKDGSVLRLADKSELKLQSATFGPKEKKHFDAKLFAGRLWAAVTKLVGTDSTFEVETTNAVAGVRGTRFAAAVEPGGDTTVRVYDGSVLVSNRPIYAKEGHTKANRVQVAGPQEVSKKQWTELVASAMQVVKVTAAGQVSQPQSFAMTTGGDDDWESWNAERDGVR
jgi:hypothetical protein